MNLILLAVPFFFLLIALELVADRVRGVSTYRLADSLNSLSAGVLSTTSGLLTKGIGLPGRHTCMTELRLTAWDFLYPALCTLPLLWKVVTLL